MRANIKDIMKTTGCDEDMANKIEHFINANSWLDWSECTMGELKREASTTLILINQGETA